MRADSTPGGSGCEEKSLGENGAKPSGRSCRVGVPLGFVTCPKHIAERKCNYWAEMTVLNVGQLAGRCPETPHRFLWQASPETPHFYADFFDF